MLKLGQRINTEAEILAAIPRSKSAKNLAEILGVTPFGKNSRAIKVIRRYNIDVSHWESKEDVEYKDIGTAKKNILLHRGHQCEKCMLTEWNGDLIELDIHHLDENNENHSPDNLILLCKNCHATTDNYAGKGNKNNRCKLFVSKEELQNDMKYLTLKDLANKHDVTPRAIKKYANKLGLKFRRVQNIGRCILTDKVVGWDADVSYETEDFPPTILLLGNEELAHS